MRTLYELQGGPPASAHVLGFVGFDFVSLADSARTAANLAAAFATWRELSNLNQQKGLTRQLACTGWVSYSRALF